MPTTLSGLLVFVALLTPGFVYLTRTETRLPGQRYSALRETAAVVSASLVSNGLTLAGFGIVRALAPDITPDVGAIVRDPGAYYQSHYVEVTLWSVGLLAAGVGLAAVFAVPPRWSKCYFAVLKFWPAPTISAAISRRLRNPITAESGWSTAFHHRPDRKVYLGLRLKDGTYLYGPLLSFSSQIEESDNRSLQIERPIKIRTPSATKAQCFDADVVVVSAGEIKTLSVHYKPKEDGPARKCGVGWVEILGIGVRPRWNR